MKRNGAVLGGALVVALGIAAWLAFGGKGTGPDGEGATRETGGPGAGTPSLAPGRAAGEASREAAAPGAPSPRAEPEGARPAWRAEGRVLDAAGKTVEGATVEASLWFGALRRELADARTTADGRYAVDLAAARALGAMRLGGATLVLRAWADGHAPSDSQALAEWPRDPRSEHSLRADLTLAPGDVLRGRVVASGGVPVGDASLVFCRDGRSEFAGRSREDGTFTLSRPTGATWVVAYSETRGSGRAAAYAGAATLPDVVLSDATRVEGRVAYTDGSPVVDVSVSAQYVGEAGAADPCLGAWIQGNARTGPDGAFRVVLPREGRVRVWSDGAPETQARTGDRDVRLTVADRRVRVRIVDEAGETVSGGDYSAVIWPAEAAERPEEILRGARDLGELRDDATEFEAGSARGTHDFFLPPGATVLFRGVVPGAGPIEVVLRAPESGNERTTTVEAKPRTGAGSLRLTVVDPAGERVPLVRVEATTVFGSGLWEGPLPEDRVVGPLPTGPVRLRLVAIRDREDRGRIPAADEWVLPTTTRVVTVAGPPADVKVPMAWGGRVRVTLRVAADAATPPASDAEYSMRLSPTMGGDFVYPMARPAEGEATVISSDFPAGKPVLTAEAIPAGEYRLEVTRSGEGWSKPAGTTLVTVLAKRVVDAEVTVR